MTLIPTDPFWVSVCILVAFMFGLIVGVIGTAWAAMRKEEYERDNDIRKWSAVKAALSPPARGRGLKHKEKDEIAY